MPTGFLAVWANPGSQVTTEEFTDWYDNEHVPLRIVLPSFLSAARYSAMKSASPRASTTPQAEWLAIYDVTAPSVFHEPSYTTLRANRSPREANVVKRTALLDRRMYEYAGQCGIPRPFGFGAGESETNKQVGCVVTQGIDCDEGSVEKWLNDLERSMATETEVEIGRRGWLGTRMFRCVEAGKNGTSVKEGEKHVFPQYLVVHEITKPSALFDESGSLLPVFQAMIRVQPGDSTVKYFEEEDGYWELHRLWKTVSQKASKS